MLKELINVIAGKGHCLVNNLISIGIRIFSMFKIASFARPLVKIRNLSTQSKSN